MFVADNSRDTPGASRQMNDPESISEPRLLSRRDQSLRDAHPFKARWMPVAFLAAAKAIGQEAAETNAPVQLQTWNWHAQNTDIVQYHPGFTAPYSGPNSMSSVNEVRETVSLDLYAGLRLWKGAEAHVDGLMWQGFGLSRTLGVEGFSNGEAFRLGTDLPNVNMARLFLRQTFALGEGLEPVADRPFALAGTQPASRITLTIGKMSAKDIFDNNAYANDSRTQFMNWALMANEAWDYPADSLGYTTGLALELNQPQWAVRYGFFQMPRTSNGTAQDPHYLQAWGMVTEFERRYLWGTHPGTVRLLAYLNSANMGSYQAALETPVRPADVEATREYRYKYGFGLNVEQEIVKNLGAFTRIGWSDGRNEAWTFSDVDRTFTLGLSIKGACWSREDDTVGIAGVFNAAATVHHEFLAVGGTGILAGDGTLTYGIEKDLEVYYYFQVWKTIHTTLDYQLVSNPAFNRDRGPISIFGARLHWEF
jgi:high affinity Mn2+ porin